MLLSNSRRLCNLCVSRTWFYAPLSSFFPLREWTVVDEALCHSPVNHEGENSSAMVHASSMVWSSNPHPFRCDVVGFVSGGHAPLHRNRSSDSGSLGFWFAICLNEPARPFLPSGRGVLSSSRWLLVFVSRQTLISELGLSQTKSIEDF